MLVQVNRARSLHPAGEGQRPGSRCLVPIVAYRSDAAVVVQRDLPGADPGTVVAGLDGDALTVPAERRGEGTFEEDGPPGEADDAPFWQRLKLGGHVDRSRVRTRHARGVVTITLPVAGSPGGTPAGGRVTVAAARPTA
ncbi:MAG TPA: Hsp20 family protein [Acidimicrobiales bacterium]|nr:Hsp20 family protein [Acidimicrobiales bacterium]